MSKIKPFRKRNVDENAFKQAAEELLKQYAGEYDEESKVKKPPRTRGIFLNLVAFTLWRNLSGSTDKGLLPIDAIVWGKIRSWYESSRTEGSYAEQYARNDGAFWVDLKNLVGDLQYNGMWVCYETVKNSINRLVEIGLITKAPQRGLNWDKGLVRGNRTRLYFKIDEDYMRAEKAIKKLLAKSDGLKAKTERKPQHRQIARADRFNPTFQRKAEECKVDLRKMLDRQKAKTKIC